MKKVSIVIPTYNVEEFIYPLFLAIKEVEKELNSMGIEIQLICVNDGSRDQTWDRLVQHKGMFKDITLVKLTRNFGAICASNAGLKYVNGDAFTIFAADMQDPLNLLIRMAQAWLDGNKYIIAVRSKTRKDPFFTRMYSALYYKLITFFVVKDFPKTGFDIAFFDSSILKYIKNTSKNINRSLFSHWLGFEPYVITYDRPKRESGKSGWTMSKKIKLFIDSFLGFSVVPIRLISLVGITASIASFMYGIVIVVGGLTGAIKSPGYASVISLITFLIGLVIVMLGIIGEYIWRIFDELNKRPEFVIDEVMGAGESKDNG